MLILVCLSLLWPTDAVFHRPHTYPVPEAPIEWHKLPESIYEVLHDGQTRHVLPLM